MKVPLDYPNLMLFEQCRQLFFCISSGVKLELSDFTKFVKYNFDVYCMLVTLLLFRNFKLISNDKFNMNDAAIVFHKLCETDGCLSFDKFITALIEISRRLYGGNIDVLLKHCKVFI